MIGCKNLDDLKAAQFIMGPNLYCEFIWQERMKANPARPSKMRVAFRWQNHPKIIDLASKRK